MIRVNLLPTKRVGRPSGGEQSQAWLGIVLGLVVLEIVGCFIIYSFKQEELDDWQRKNDRVTAQIKESKAKVADHADVTAKLEVLRAREDAIAKLQSARTGPTAVLLEIARLMTRGRGPSVKPEKLAETERDNPLAMYNPKWDSRQVWLTAFEESDRTVKLAGVARDGEDVSELAKRMNLSTYFYDVRLLPGARTQNWVNFKLEARVRY